MAVHGSVTVRREPSVVFRWIADPTLAARWQLGVLEYEITHEEPEVVGTTFRQVVGDEKGSIQLRGEVTGYVSGEVLELLVVGRGLRVRTRYDVAPDPVGARVDVTADARIGGPLGVLLTPFTRGRTAKQLRAELARLRELCEA